MRARPLPPLERVREVLDYDPTTGQFTWMVDRGGCKGSKKGDSAGHIAESGYRLISIDGSTYRAHRLAWLLVKGEDPMKLEVDHIDMDRSNNRFDNLRLATHQENKYNIRASSRSTTGRRSVYFAKHHKTKPYYVIVRVEGVQKNLGYFHTLEEAVIERDKVIREVHGEFARFD